MDMHLVERVCRVSALSLVAVGGPLAVWGVIRLWCGRGRSLCPGPRRSWAWRVWPLSWVFIRGCRYELTGLPRREDGATVCPECGRVIRCRREVLRHAYRWRPGRIGLAVVTLALLVRVAPLLKTSSWQHHVPTTALILTKRALGTHLPTRLRRELVKRVWAKQLSDWQACLLVPALARDMRDDRRVANAGQSSWLLQSLGDPGRRQLERSLLARDYQERQFAASVLRQLCFEWEEGKLLLRREPSEDLLRVTVEGLRLDYLDYESGISNARGGYGFLARFAERARPHIARGLECGDPQRKLYCAGLVALTGATALLPQAAPILVEHLRNNPTRRDAEFAARALYALGPGTDAYLSPRADSDDAQQRALVRLIRTNLAKPSAKGRSFPDERALELITRRVSASMDVLDPAAPDFGELQFAW